MATHILVRHRGLFLAGVMALLSPQAAGVAGAQSLTPDQWHQGSALALFGGLTVSDDTRSVVGGSIIWELTPRLSVDAGGRWFSVTGRDQEVFGSVGIRYVVTGVRPVTPYVNAGVGLYHATFARESLQHAMPGFYRRRMEAGAAASRRTFDDFAARVGAGIEIYLGRHVSIRPEVEIVGVTDRDHARVVPVAGLHLAYHFESHPITPSRR